LIFDTTNAKSYPEVYLALCEVFADVRKSGGRTPQIAFMVNTKAGKTATEIYHDLYQKKLFRDLWFNWQGKPLMICDPEKADAELQKVFTLRRAHWPFTMENTKNAWHWEATYPQPYGFTDDATKPEQVNVSVAQNLRADNGRVENMSSGDARGRSFHDGKQNIAPGSVDRGGNFEEQWQRAFELSPPFVMVTGWNEWTAGRWIRPGQPILFVDQYDEEFSRDIEPMRGGHGDNYYWQLIANVRRYKGAPALPKISAPKTISITGNFAQWRDVSPEFRDHVGETQPRDFAGSGGKHYTNNSGRNDFAALKVARDATNIFFYAKTVKPIVAAGILPAVEPGFQPGGKSSAPTLALEKPNAAAVTHASPGGGTPPSTSGKMPDATGTNWMWLFIDADQNAATGWAGYDFIVNRAAGADRKFWLEKNVGGWKWERVALVELRVAGNELQLAIPRAALGVVAGSKVNFDFKWADNLQSSGDVLDFYVSGDVAPEGRFNFRIEGE
jgi:hypothetical protein